MQLTRPPGWQTFDAPDHDVGRLSVGLHRFGPRNSGANDTSSLLALVGSGRSAAYKLQDRRKTIRDAAELAIKDFTGIKIGQADRLRTGMLKLDGTSELIPSRTRTRNERVVAGAGGSERKSERSESRGGNVN